jgi:hypothetical protein
MSSLIFHKTTYLLSLKKLWVITLKQMTVIFHETLSRLDPASCSRGYRNLETSNNVRVEQVTCCRLCVFTSPLACFPLKLICKYGSCRQLVGLLERVIGPVTKPLLTQDDKNTEKRGKTSMPRVGFEPTIPVCEWTKTFYALRQRCRCDRLFPKCNSETSKWFLITLVLVV